MLTGGDILGSGVYGCVYMPPLDCKPGTEQSIPKNEKHGGIKQVDKLLSIKNAKTEFALSKRIHQIPDWETYFVVPDTMCEPAPVSQQKDKDIGKCEVVTGDDLSNLRILRMNFGGEALDSYKIDVKQFNFRNFATTALEAVTLLILNQISHMDLHSGNVLLDKHQSAHLIDWNLSIDVLNETRLEERLYHNYSLKLTQESPDYLVVNAKYRKVTQQDSKIPSEDTLIQDMVEQKPILKRQRAVLGITKDEQARGIRDFMRGSRAYQTGDLPAWYKAHWQMNDSWAIASMIVGVIARLSLWPEYQFPSEFNGPRSAGYRVLRKMCRTNPFERYDAVQGLAELYPENPIIRMYAGSWLASLRSRRA
jgi:hypothetical protein